jgi:hypothetical protein
MVMRQQAAADHSERASDTGKPLHAFARGGDLRVLALPEIQAVLPIDGVISYVQRHDDFLLNREDDSQIRGDTQTE